MQSENTSRKSSKKHFKQRIFW